MRARIQALTHRAICAAILMTPAAALCAERSGVFDHAVVVHVYDITPERRASVRQGGTVAQAIFREAGLDLQLLFCAPGAGPMADSHTACGAMPPSAMIVRIMPEPRTVQESQRPGCALVDETTLIGAVASVYEDRIAKVERRLGLDPGVLLGRVMAHEIGHLLGIAAHSHGGLMRGNWSLRDLKQDHARFLFAAHEAEELRERAAVRRLRTAE